MPPIRRKRKFGCMKQVRTAFEYEIMGAHYFLTGDNEKAQEYFKKAEMIRKETSSHSVNYNDRLNDKVLKHRGENK